MSDVERLGLEGPGAVGPHQAEPARPGYIPSALAVLIGQGRSRLRARLQGAGGARAVLLYASMPGLSAINAVVGLLLPALLGPAGFGQYAIAVTLFQYGLILDCGMSQLADRRLSVLLAEGDDGRLHRMAQETLWVRAYVAAAALAAGAAVLAVLEQAGRLPFPPLAGLLSLTAGLAFMLALGPMAVWRATTRRSAFAVWSAACAINLAVARPVGMVFGGLHGCFGLLAAGFIFLALRLQATMPLQADARPGVRRTAALLAAGAPLFATSFVWAFYMTANRWVVSFLAPGLELGQFAFGANVVYLIVGTVGALSQLHYPAVVTRAAANGAYAVSKPLARDLSWLALGISLPIAFGIVAGPRLIDLLYPSFAGAEGPVRALLVAVPSLVVASWLMPLSLSTAKRPWIEGVLIYPAALAVLMGATWTGFHLDGIEGAGWGLVASAVPLVILQLSNLRHTRLLSTRHAGVIFLAIGSATAFLGVLARLT